MAGPQGHTPENEMPESSSLALERVPFLVGMDIEPVYSSLEEIIRQEGAIVSGAFPPGSPMVGQSDPSESLVVLASAKNLMRAPNSSRDRIYVKVNGVTYYGSPRGDEVDPRGGIQNYTFYKTGQDTKYSPLTSAISVESTDPWSFNEQELEHEIVQKDALTALKNRYAEAHPLGRGAILLTNRYGGVDPTNPDASTRSLLTRFLYARQLNLPNELGRHGNDSPSVHHGLLDRRLEKLFGEDWLKLRESINPSLDVLEQLQGSGQDPASVTATLETLVRAHTEAFIEKWGSKLILAAQLLRDPDGADRVVGALIDTDSQFSAELKQGSIDTHRKR